MVFLDPKEASLLGDWGWSHDGILQSGFIIFNLQGECKLLDLEKNSLDNINDCTWIMTESGTLEINIADIEGEELHVMLLNDD